MLRSGDSWGFEDPHMLYWLPWNPRSLLRVRTHLVGRTHSMPSDFAFETFPRSKAENRYMIIAICGQRAPGGPRGNRPTGRIRKSYALKTRLATFPSITYAETGLVRVDPTIDPTLLWGKRVVAVDPAIVRLEDQGDPHIGFLDIDVDRAFLFWRHGCTLMDEGSIRAVYIHGQVDERDERFGTSSQWELSGECLSSSG